MSGAAFRATSSNWSVSSSGAIEHPGFAVLDVFSPCVTFNARQHLRLLPQPGHPAGGRGARPLRLEGGLREARWNGRTGSTPGSTSGIRGNSRCTPSSRFWTAARRRCRACRGSDHAGAAGPHRPPDDVVGPGGPTMLSAAGFPDRRTRRFGPSEAAPRRRRFRLGDEPQHHQVRGRVGEPLPVQPDPADGRCAVPPCARGARSARRAPFRFRDFGELLLLALCGHTIFQTGLIHGTDASSASSSALILSLTPVAIAAIAWATRTEPFCHHTAAGLALSVSGILFVSGTEQRAVAHLGTWVSCARCWAGRSSPCGAPRWCAATGRSGRGPGPPDSGHCCSGLPAPFLLAPDDFRSAPDAFWMAAIVLDAGRDGEWETRSGATRRAGWARR